MEYRLELGAWGSVFAVPTELTDKHLKLAGAAQLKVILWFLRHAGEAFTTADISSALSMHEADVRDCMQYWIEAGLIAHNDNNILTPPMPAVQTAPDTETESTAGTEEKAAETETITEIQAETRHEPEKTQTRLPSRPEKPDQKYLSERMTSDPGIAFLMQSADEIFGRLTNISDKATLLMIHEYDGLPVEVLIMLMQYAHDAGKCNMRYIEKTAISWADEEITTLEAAERKIKELSEKNTAARRYQRIIGLDDHSPTKKELEFADLWINKRKYPDELIREAYETCIDNKGKFIQKYTNTILENWYKTGITSVSQLKNQQSERKKAKPQDSYSPSYDISEYESTSILDEEGWDDE